MDASDQAAAGGGDRVPRGPVVFVAVLAGVIGFAGGYVAADRVWEGRSAKMAQEYQAALEKSQKAQKNLLGLFGAAGREQAGHEGGATSQP